MEYFGGRKVGQRILIYVTNIAYYVDGTIYYYI